MNRVIHAVVDFKNRVRTVEEDMKGKVNHENKESELLGRFLLEVYKFDWIITYGPCSTLPETNSSAPETRSLEEGIPIGNHHV